MVSSNVVIQVSHDVEGRLANIISVASGFSSRIYIITEDKKINAKSLMGMMNLVSSTGDTITVQAEGSDEAEAVKTIVDYINN